MKKSIVIIVLAAMLLAVSGGAGYFFMSRKAAAKAEVFVYDPGDFFVTNVVDSKCLIKTDIIIETNNKETYKFFESNQFKVRDTVIEILRSKKFHDMMQPEVQGILKQEIKTALESNFGLAGIDSIYFNEFVVQQ
ncbi:MAG: flagellar basal body-associated FliL family protein [Clostridia bacterium]|nr:flagellar basal body-associated FliL family protein [Clostridia bacterium]